MRSVEIGAANEAKSEFQLTMSHQSGRAVCLVISRFLFCRSLSGGRVAHTVSGSINLPAEMKAGANVNTELTLVT